MASTNEEVAALLREYAELLVLTGGDPFRVRSYEKAAKAVAGCPDDLGALPEAGLTRVPGVGSSIAAKIIEYRRTGTIKAVDELRATVPPGALMLAKVPGVGPKRALQLARELRVTTVADLGAAVRGGRLRGLPGFGPKTEERILRGIGVAASDGALRDALRALPDDATEDDIYAVLAAHVAPPAAGAGDGDHGLVRTEDLRGDLHTHTDLTDGVAPLADMVAAAAARGYSYYAVTDHAPNLFMQRMTDEKMLAQRAEVARLEGHYDGMRLLHGTELNIGPHGEVDWPAEFLDRFDLCVASVHSHFTQPREEMTRRMLRAVENPHVAILGHPTTRLIGRRPPVDMDLDAVYEACARTGTAIEIDAFPDRLDLSAEHVRLARRHGVKFSVDTDAHAVGHLAVMRYGIGTAQRGWLTPGDVINTWPLPRLMAFLQAKRGT